MTGRRARKSFREKEGEKDKGGGGGNWQSPRKKAITKMKGWGGEKIKKVA